MLIKVEMIAYKKVTQFLKFTDQKSDKKIKHSLASDGFTLSQTIRTLNLLAMPL